MSSFQKNVDVNLGRTNIHGDLGIQRGQQQVVGAQPIITQAPLVTGVQSTAIVTGVETTSAQTDVLISNEPKTVVMQEQRIASNIPITTEKHITREFIPVVHEEIVTRVPIVTGQAVHTGTAIAGEKFVQQVGAEIVRQSAATKIDVIPEVQTQLGAQQVINMPVSGQAQYVGKATVVSEQQLLGQQHIQQQQLLGQQQQNLLNQQHIVTQSLPAQTLGTQQFTTQQTFSQPIGSQLLQGQQHLGQQQFSNLSQPLGQQNLLNQNLMGTNQAAKNQVAAELNAAANLTQQAARDIKKV